MIVCWVVVIAGCATTARAPDVPAVGTPTAGVAANVVPSAGVNAAASAAPNAGVNAAASAAPSAGVNAAAPNAGVSAAPTAGAAGNAPAASTKAAAIPAPTDAAGRPVSRSLLAQGYQPTNYHGQLVYCRKEKLTGSQFTHKVCLTEQEAAIQERIAQDEMMKRGSQGKCVPPLCPNH